MSPQPCHEIREYYEINLCILHILFRYFIQHVHSSKSLQRLYSTFSYIMEWFIMKVIETIRVFNFFKSWNFIRQGKLPHSRPNGSKLIVRKLMSVYILELNVHNQHNFVHNGHAPIWVRNELIHLSSKQIQTFRSTADGKCTILLPDRERLQTGSPQDTWFCHERVNSKVAACVPCCYSATMLILMFVYSKLQVTYILTTYRTSK